MLFGFQKQEMTILAARPSMGKTSLALNFVEAAALPQNPKKTPPVGVLLFSLEMGSAQIALRMLCSHARVKHAAAARRFRWARQRGNFAARALGEALKTAPIMIDDSSSISIMECGRRPGAWPRSSATRRARHDRGRLPADGVGHGPEGEPRAAGGGDFARIKGHGEGTPRAGDCPLPSSTVPQKKKTECPVCPTFANPARSSRTPTSY
jgi:hypothetical protein